LTIPHHPETTARARHGLTEALSGSDRRGIADFRFLSGSLSLTRLNWRDTSQIRL